jgi:D-amino-acid oxidase
MQDMKPVSVLGAGVVGLTSGIALQEAGYRVTIFAREVRGATLSANSGAIWGPFLSTLDSRVLGWSFETLRQLLAFSKEVSTGVSVVSGLLASEVEGDVPEWIKALNQEYKIDTDKIPVGYVSAWKYAVPIIDMPVYLDYLLLKFLAIGGSIISRTVFSLSELTDFRIPLVNCSGLASRVLADDNSVTPSKGQLVVLENPGISEFFAERGDGPSLLYVLPQGAKVVLGGTAEDMVDNCGLDLEVAQRIIERCSQVHPSLAQQRILSHRVGVRPCRPTVRLELDIADLGGTVVHNYGHGGSGVSISWGCARAVTELISGVCQ